MNRNVWFIMLCEYRLGRGVKNARASRRFPGRGPLSLKSAGEEEREQKENQGATGTASAPCGRAGLEVRKVEWQGHVVVLFLVCFVFVLRNG